MEAMWNIARRRLGLITRAQALQLVSKAELRGLVDRGYLVVRRRGVYAVAGAPETYEQAVLAAVLAAGDFARASQRTAARLWSLRVPPPELIDVLTLPNRRLRLDGVAQHRNQRLELPISQVGVVPVTSVAQTLVDCLPFLPGRMYVRAVDDAKRRGLLTYEQLEAAHAAIDRGPKTGRHLVVPGRPVVADRRHAGGSDREIDVLEVIRRAGLPEPVQQFPIIVAGRQRYLDYAYPAKRVYLEFDGFAEHGLIREVFDDDRDRDAELGLMGWLKLAFTSNTRESDIVRRIGTALDRVLDTSCVHDAPTVHNPGTMAG